MTELVVEAMLSAARDIHARAENDFFTVSFSATTASSDDIRDAAHALHFAIYDLHRAHVLENRLREAQRALQEAQNLRSTVRQLQVEHGVEEHRLVAVKEHVNSTVELHQREVAAVLREIEDYRQSLENPICIG